MKLNLYIIIHIYVRYNSDENGCLYVCYGGGNDGIDCHLLRLQNDKLNFSEMWNRKCHKQVSYALSDTSVRSHKHGPHTKHFHLQGWNSGFHNNKAMNGNRMNLHQNIKNNFLSLKNVQD